MAGYVPPYMQPYGYMTPNQQMMAQQLPQPMPQMMTMPQQPQMMQQMQPAQSQTPAQAIVRVRGEAAAKAWIVAPGQTVYMLDTEAPYLYINEVGPDNIPRPFQKFRITNESDGMIQAEQASVQPASADDLAKLTARVNKLEEALANGQSGT